MSLLRSLGPALLVSTLSVGGLLPAAAQTAGGPEEPVSVIALTAQDGTLTPLADDGLEALAATPATAARRSAGTDSVTAESEVPEGVAVLTAPIATSEFYVAGVTWDGADAMPADAALFIRVMEGGQWQEWAELEVEVSADEPGAVGGTEPYTAAAAEAVQVQVTGRAESLPPNLRLSLTPEWPGDEEVVLAEDAPAATVAPTTEPLAPAAEAALPYEQPAGRTTATAATSADAVEESGIMTSAVATASLTPSVVSRAGWGADESKMTWTPKPVALKAAIVHHTAGTNNYTQSQSASIVRGIYSYHAVSRGWGDIGYNFLVDRWGRVYEGRRGSLAAASGTMPVGAHAAPFNTGSMGLSVMGDYTTTGVTDAAMSALADVVAWQMGRAGLSATGSSGMISPGTAARPKGQNLGRVFAHRDVSATACPGDDIYSRIGWIARAADARIAAAGPQVPGTPSTPSTPAPEPVPATGHVYLNNGWGPVADVEYPFGAEGAQVVVGDWDGNGTDTLGTRRGNVFSVYNENAPDAPAWTIAYGRADDEVFIGDWDGDGKDSIAVRRGATFYIKNKVLGGAADHEFVYGRPGDEVFVGDWNADGKDTFAVRRGAVLHVKNNVAGGPADHVIAYGKPGDTMLVGDWDGDGVDSFAVRRGAVYHVKNRIATGPADLVIPYGRENDAVLVGDWNGDRTDTLGVYRPRQ